MLRKALLWLGLALVLVAVNASIFGRERLLANGALLRLALAPVDPRSLMQGDYMALRFRVAVDAAAARAANPPPPAGNDAEDWRANEASLLVLGVDARGVGSFRRFYVAGSALAADERLLRYRVRDGRMRLATDAWFFEEGRAADYAAAAFGEFRVAADGEALLTGMLDLHLAPLGTERR